MKIQAKETKSKELMSRVLAFKVRAARLTMAIDFGKKCDPKRWEFENGTEQQLALLEAVGEEFREADRKIRLEVETFFGESIPMDPLWEVIQSKLRSFKRESTSGTRKRRLQNREIDFNYVSSWIKNNIYGMKALEDMHILLEADTSLTAEQHFIIQERIEALIDALISEVVYTYVGAKYDDTEGLLCRDYINENWDRVVRVYQERATRGLDLIRHQRLTLDSRYQCWTKDAPGKPSVKDRLDKAVAALKKAAVLDAQSESNSKGTLESKTLGEASAGSETVLAFSAGGVGAKSWVKSTEKSDASVEFDPLTADSGVSSKLSTQQKSS